MLYMIILKSKHDKDVLYVIPNDYNYVNDNIDDVILVYNDMVSLVFRHTKIVIMWIFILFFISKNLT